MAFSAFTTKGRSEVGGVVSALIAAVRHQVLGLVNGHTAMQVRQLPQCSCVKGRSL